MFWIILIQLLFAAYNVWNAKYHARLFDKHIKISHALWTVYYCIIVAPFFFVNPWLPLLGLLQRIPIFNPVVNLSRVADKKSFWYLGTESTIDRLISKHYKPIYFGCIAAVIILNTILILW